MVSPFVVPLRRLILASAMASEATPELAERLAQELSSGGYECMICLRTVDRPKDASAHRPRLRRQDDDSVKVWPCVFFWGGGSRGG